MPKIAYLQCPTGIAGDMCLGALVHAGVPLDYLISQLGRLEIASEFQLGAELVQRNSQQATKFHVTLTNNQDPNDYTSVNSVPLAINQEHNQQDFIHNQQHDHAHSDHSFHQHDHAHSKAHSYSHSHSDSHSQTHNNSDDHSHSHDHAVNTASPNKHQPHRHLPEITEIIKKAKLPARVEAWSLAIFQKLAEAEGAVHGVPAEQVHFHEVGATDAIVDIVGTCLGLDWLNIEQLYCSPLPTGGGTIWAAHGRLAVPVPAVLRLWQTRQVPVYSNGIEKELCTPTGVAIACTLATSFGPPPAMSLSNIGYGAGERDLVIPNILQLWVGEIDSQISLQTDQQLQPVFNTAENIEDNFENNIEQIAVLETQIDDQNPQAIAYTLEALLEAGALDVFTQAITMKKSRSGLLLTVICYPEQVKNCENIIFQETTTLGIRRSFQNRHFLQREIHTINTEWGIVRVKVAKNGNKISNIQPEYEDCAKIAKQYNLSWRFVHQKILQTGLQNFQSDN